MKSFIVIDITGIVSFFKGLNQQDAVEQAIAYGIKPYQVRQA